MNLTQWTSLREYIAAEIALAFARYGEEMLRSNHASVDTRVAGMKCVEEIEAQSTRMETAFRESLDDARVERSPDGFSDAVATAALGLTARANDQLREALDVLRKIRAHTHLCKDEDWSLLIESTLEWKPKVGVDVEPVVQSPDDYVAWLHYIRGTIRLCDSDTEGAFKVYRHPSRAQESIPPQWHEPLPPEAHVTTWCGVALDPPATTYAEADRRARAASVPKMSRHTFIEGAAQGYCRVCGQAKNDPAHDIPSGVPRPE